MKEILNNKNGYALLMALLMLVVVGTLVGALMTAGVFNIQFRTDEATRVQAFYAAEAGIEYVRDAVKQEDFSIDDLEGLSRALSDNFKFELELDEDDSNTIISTGKYEGISMLRRGSIEEKLAMDFTFDGIDLEGVKTDIPFHLDEQINFHNSNNTQELDDNLFRKIYDNEDVIKPQWDLLDSINKNNFISEIKDEINNELIYIDGNYNIKHNEIDGPIKNSVIIINGDLDIQSHVEFEDSYIFVNGHFEVGGTPNSQITRSLVFLYGNNQIKINGNWQNSNWNFDSGPNIDINDIGNFSAGNINITNWRKVR